MIYLDNAAGTRPHSEVIETITNVLMNHWGNASADYSFGKDAMSIIDGVTQQVTDDINCSPNEIIWTSGACEANSLAIHGIAHNNDVCLFTSELEHTSIYLALNDLNLCYTDVIYIKNDINGNIILSDLSTKLDNYVYNDWLNDGQPFVTISFANSEIGTIQNIKEIAKLVHEYDGILHVDATQMYPWYQIDVKDLGIDMMSVSGQKLNCVKGVGFLYVKDGIKLEPLIYGSQQESRRGGTYPTHLIAAFGAALKLTRECNASENVKVLRDHLASQLLLLDGVYLVGPGVDYGRLPNNIALTIEGVKAETLVTMCDLMGVIIGKGSACKSHEPKPSDTLLSVGLSPEQALNTIRISLDSYTSLSDVNEAASIITKLIERIRSNV